MSRNYSDREASPLGDESETFRLNTNNNNRLINYVKYLTIIIIRSEFLRLVKGDL